MHQVARIIILKNISDLLIIVMPNDKEELRKNHTITKYLIKLIEESIEADKHQRRLQQSQH